jgi:hypothetical protein
VATALGHSEGVMRKNYLALVTKAQAALFWNLRPELGLAKITEVTKINCNQ